MNIKSLTKSLIISFVLAFVLIAIATYLLNNMVADYCYLIRDKVLFSKEWCIGFSFKDIYFKHFTAFLLLFVGIELTNPFRFNNELDK